MTGMKRLLALLLCGTLLLAGCSQGNKTDDSRGNTTGQAVPGSMEEPQNSSENDSETTDNSGNDSVQGNDGTQDDGSDMEDTTATYDLSPGEEYSDMRRTVSILGLKEYQKLKGDSYTDKAKKGKVFLVLFLKIYNTGSTKEYFNVNCLNARVDGKEIENTFLVNPPEGYPTIFDNIEAGETLKGFIVWEVPEDWKKMEVDYQGWRDSDGVSLTCSLTPKDLKKPEKHEP